MSSECLQSSNDVTTSTSNSVTTEQLPASNSTTSNSTSSSIRHVNNINRSNNSESDLTTLAATGNLLGLRERIEDNTIQVDPDQSQSGTGLRPLHFAASRGYLNIVTYLIENAGAIVDATDQEGETALLKAAYAGHMSIVEYLVNMAQANTIHQDKDGWSVLHNACSSGHLFMVRFLVNRHVPVNARSRIGNTPLINAASKGDIAVVEYLLNETEADPLLCNKFGETAYDAAAAIGHVYLCELLEVAERSYWVDPTRGGRRDGPYNSLSIHITIPVLIHENQRSIATVTPSLLLKRTSSKKAISFSSTALNKNDSRKAWSLYPSGEPTTKSHVKLPPLERTSAWFWLTDWTVDYSHPNTDQDGWQYSKAGFDTDEWTSVYPTTGTGWVRRRRWMRIMKRRIDNHPGSSEQGQVQEQQIEEDNNHHHNAHVIPSSSLSSSSSSSSSSTAAAAATSSSSSSLIIQGQQDSLSLLRQQVLQGQASGGSSSSSSSANNNNNNNSHGTVSMSLTKAQSVFVGCTAAHAQPTVETTTTITTDVEPSPRRSSFEWTRSARSSIASSHSRPTFVWEPNEQASECRRCGRWFNLIVRRHHCRRCGLVVCDKCSNRVMLLPFSHIVVDPAVPLEQHYLVSLQPQRVCDGCYEELSRPRGSFSSSNNHNNATTSAIPNNNSISNSRSSSIRMRRSPSAQSIMMECPVCGKDLDEYDGSTNEQELHVQACLNANTPVALSGIRYVVYKLPPNSALMGQECVICLEEFVQGNTMARLNCFCTFHHACINSWFAKGKECPLHSQ